MPYAFHNILIHWQLDWLFNSSFNLQIIGPLWENLPMTGEFLSQRAYNAKGISIVMMSSWFYSNSES